MPVFNVAPFLREAMDSILNQTYTDFELIVLNDCSPDNSEEILDSYSDSRIVRYLGKENVGLANVLNIGLKMAKGEFIARMDSDDISLPMRLEKQVAIFRHAPGSRSRLCWDATIW
jgi:Glycosyltransferases involved in cell wall biogenesis